MQTVQVLYSENYLASVGSTRTSSYTSNFTPSFVKESTTCLSGGSFAIFGSVITHTFLTFMVTRSIPISRVTPGPYRMVEHAICACQTEVSVTVCMFILFFIWYLCITTKHVLQTLCNEVPRRVKYTDNLEHYITKNFVVYTVYLVKHHYFICPQSLVTSHWLLTLYITPTHWLVPTLLIGETASSLQLTCHQCAYFLWWIHLLRKVSS